MKSLIIVALRALMRLLFRVEVRGSFANIPPERLLVVANHESFLDGLLLGLFLPFNPVFVIHTGVVKNPMFRLVLSLCDYLTVEPANPMAMKQVIRLLEAGRTVVIFPEGRITTTGSLMKVYEGPAFVAAKTGATVLPIRLHGTTRTYFSRMGGAYPRQLFPKITLSILPARPFPMPDGSNAHQRRHRAGEALRRLMQEMVFSTEPSQTLPEALLQTIKTHGRGRRLFEDMKQTPYTYNDLLKMSLILGKHATHGLAADSKVGLLLPNVVPTLGLVFGINFFRCTPAMLNYTAGSEAMQAACTAAQIQRVITSRAFVEQGKLTDKLTALQGVEIVYLEDIRAQISLADKLWLMLWALPFPRQVIQKQDSEAPAVVLFTSGSEGKPKGVVLSHRALLANVAQIRAIVDFSVDDKMLNALPLFHSFGLTGGGLLPVLSGFHLFLYPSPLHYRVIPELAYDRGCTILLGTSTFLGNYAKFAHPYDFYRLRYVIAGAEKLSEAVRNTWFEKFGLRIFEGYGATETAPVLAVNTPMAYCKGTVGQLLPGVEAKLLPVPGINQGGILHVRGANVMSGYLRSDAPGVLEKPSSEVGAGWYNTGDVVDIDADGFVHIVGRVKRFAKLAGEMISLEVVEKLAIAAAPKAHHAVSTQPDASKGEALVLFTTDPELKREALLNQARAQGVPELAVPRKIVMVEALPLLGTGKTDYVTLKAWAEAA